MITDIKSQLARNTNSPYFNTSRNRTGFLTIHWNGPYISPSTSDLGFLRGAANYHVNTHGWDGLAYHYAIGRDGTIYRCRDYWAKLPHSGVNLGNNESLAVIVIAGDGNTIPSAQYSGLSELIRLLQIPARYILGHQEWPRSTSCPGAQLMRWLNNYRGTWSNPDYTAKTVFNANVRDEPSVLSDNVGSISAGKNLEGKWVLGKPVKGDSLWFQIKNTTNYIHASALDSNGIR